MKILKILTRRVYDRHILYSWCIVYQIAAYNYYATLPMGPR